ncbi:MAG: DNA lyase [Desulfacinum sp.]|nr:DNA lyase [Desulfacinum sp.]
MRLWSLHPCLLDPKGLVALWREALLAKAVLEGRTRGYRHHPQLVRFRVHDEPLSAIRAYLAVVLEEAQGRGYRFDAAKIGGAVEPVDLIGVTEGQIRYERQHLLAKLAGRAPQWYARVRRMHPVPVHPLFRVIPGDVEPWEIR